MVQRVEEKAVLKNVDIKYRNFAGRAGQYNQHGKRLFSAFLSDEIADEMTKAGWNVKCLIPKEEGDPQQCHLPVEIRFPGKDEDMRPPKVVMISSMGRTLLDEETIQLLDFADIKEADLIINPYNWDVNGKQGVKAYLHSLYVTINEDELELKYANVPESAASALHEMDGLD